MWFWNIGLFEGGECDREGALTELEKFCFLPDDYLQ